MKKTILICVGTRPNLIKITKFQKCVEESGKFNLKILHTGQHYDYKMSGIFFDQLGVPKPDVMFELKGESQVEKITEIMNKFETYVTELNPDIVLVPGDVNSSMACGIVASRLGFKVGHIEAGLRSYDRSMPEEINRLLIDELSDIFFVTEPSGLKNLKEEKKDNGEVHYVGNTMIDSLIQFKPVFEESTIVSDLGVEKGNYFVFTFHRPGNVDDKSKLEQLVNVITNIAQTHTVVFPIHPRTLKNVEQFGLKGQLENSNIKLIEPAGYIDFMQLISNAKGVITDSGGIQEETTFMQVPCLTIRPNTERPVTSDIGSNTLLPLEETTIMGYVNQIMDGTYKKGEIPEYWDGNATDRIVQAIDAFLN